MAAAAAAAPLPSTRSILSSLLSELSLRTHEAGSESESLNLDELSAQVPQARTLLLSLHCLLPSALLPALDLLDRGCVARWELSPLEEEVKQEGESGNTEEVVTEQTAPNTSLPIRKSTPAPVYYVSSTAPPAAAIPSRFATSAPKKYEVRPLAWSCTCAGFVFAAFNTTTLNDPVKEEQESEVSGGMEQIWGGSWGGPGTGVPVCKHLLAVVLAERCGGIFARQIVQKQGTAEELAGLAVVWD